MPLNLLSSIPNLRTSLILTELNKNSETFLLGDISRDLFAACQDADIPSTVKDTVLHLTLLPLKKRHMLKEAHGSSLNFVNEIYCICVFYSHPFSK